jgi:hypothetical protein
VDTTGLTSLPPSGTLILRAIESLNVQEQEALRIWIESSAARLVSVCETPLYPRVMEGGFSANLYYRINTVLIDVMATALPHDEIARRAYLLYERRGRHHGREWQDWFQAERELTIG